MKKNIILFIIIIIAVGAGSFYGGLKYGQSRRSTDFQNFRNLSPEVRQQMMNAGNRAASQNGGNFINGEIISKDNQTLTVKLRDGGSKIVILSGSTEIGKLATGTAEDLAIGKTIMVSGQSNDDGSVTAQSIQIGAKAPVQPPDNNQ